MYFLPIFSTVDESKIVTANPKHSKNIRFLPGWELVNIDWELNKMWLIPDMWWEECNAAINKMDLKAFLLEIKEKKEALLKSVESLSFIIDNVEIAWIKENIERNIIIELLLNFVSWMAWLIIIPERRPTENKDDRLPLYWIGEIYPR